MITHEKLKEILSYNPCDGAFLWKESRGRMRIGSAAGTTREDGYTIIRIYGKNYLASRLAWLYSYRKWPQQQIDHIDRNPCNNSIWNLRDVTPKENSNNSRKNIRAMIRKAILRSLEKD